MRGIEYHRPARSHFHEFDMHPVFANGSAKGTPFTTGLSVCAGTRDEIDAVGGIAVRPERRAANFRSSGNGHGSRWLWRGIPGDGKIASTGAKERGGKEKKRRFHTGTLYL